MAHQGTYVEPSVLEKDCRSLQTVFSLNLQEQEQKASSENAC